VVARTLRTVKVGFWLGWQIQSNWTDPFLFFIYSLARPLGGTFILVFMFYVVAGGRRGAMLDFFVVGAALWPTVVAALMGLAYGVLEDREHFKTTQYIYTAPIPFWAYLVGRGLASTVIGLPATILTLAVAIGILRIPVALPVDRLPYFLAALTLGVVGLLAVGMAIVGSLFIVSGEAWRMPEAVGQALYLLCGAIFPVTVLPNWLEPVARALPITYWLEAMRRAVLSPDAVRSFPAYSDLAVLGLLAAVSAIWIGAATLAFLGGLTRARQQGILDASSTF